MDAQQLFLALCSGMTPDSALGILGDKGFEPVACKPYLLDYLYGPLIYWFKCLNIEQSSFHTRESYEHVQKQPEKFIQHKTGLQYNFK